MAEAARLPPDPPRVREAGKTGASSDHPVPAARLPELIMAIGQRLELEFNRAVRPYGLNANDTRILQRLSVCGADEGLSPTELRRHIALSSGAMTAALDRLERQVLIRRVACQTDLRRYTATLTPAGLALSEKVQRVSQDVMASLLPSLGETAIRDTEQALEPLLNTLISLNAS